MFDRCSGSLQKLPPPPSSELANTGCRREAFVGEVAVNVGGSGLLAVLDPAIVFSISITTQPIHLSLLHPCFFCMQVIHREDREEEEEQRVKEPEEN